MSRIRLTYVAMCVVPLLTMLTLAVARPRGIEMLANFVFDSYQRLKPRVWSADSRVRIIDVDEESLTRIGQWPWPRTRLADLVDMAALRAAAVVAFDAVFAEADRMSPEQLLKEVARGSRSDTLAKMLADLPSHDDTFARSMIEMPTVLGAILSDYGAATWNTPVKAGVSYAGDDPLRWIPNLPRAAQPLPRLAAAAAGVASLNWLPSIDQVVREVPMLLRSGETIVPGFGIETLRVMQGASGLIIRSSNASGQTAYGQFTGINAIKVGAYEIATDAQGERRIYFSHTNRQRFIPAWKFLAGEVPMSEIEGRVLIVGVSASGLLDLRATPLDPVVPGVEVHAQLIEHIMEGGSLSRPDWAQPAELIAALLLTAAVTIIAYFASPLQGALLGFLAVSAMLTVGWHLFSVQGILVDPLYPSLTAALSYLGGVVELFSHERGQKAQVTNAFGRYVSPAVVERLTRQPDRLVLGGESRELTVMFCDLRDFTGLSEGLDAQQVINFMNDYLTPMTDLILASNGTIDKYMGDAIMAFWNAPLNDPDHGRSACLTALAMCVALKTFNGERDAAAEAQGTQTRTAKFGIGLNTGVCSVGNLGSMRRFDYSAIGDPVNVASRLEGLTKFYGLELLIAEETQREAPDLAWLEVDIVQVKGRDTPTRIFTLAGDQDVAVSKAFYELRSSHDDMLRDYRCGQFTSAIVRARSLSRSYVPLAIFYTRFATLIEEAAKAPADKWSPVRSMKEK